MSYDRSPRPVCSTTNGTRILMDQRYSARGRSANRTFDGAHGEAGLAEVPALRPAGDRDQSDHDGDLDQRADDRGERRAAVDPESRDRNRDCELEVVRRGGERKRRGLRIGRSDLPAEPEGEG